MYETHYGFSEKPFNLTPDPKYLYLSHRHGEAFAHLVFGHRERGGFVLITGEVGTGKTTLARSFLAKLGPETSSAVVLYPALTAAELLRSILQDLHVPDPGGSLKELVDALHAFLLKSRREGREVVLLIDEAQNLSAEVLEQIRLLSNLETDTDKLIHIVLMGQSELQELLGRHELRQLAQRITARYHLGALSPAETDDYIRHRLEVAGGAGKVSFSREALAAIHRTARGLPRLINLICDRALLGGYARGTREIDAALVHQAAREVLGDAPRPGPVARVPRWAWMAAALVFAGLIAAWAARPGRPVAALPSATPSSAPARPAVPALQALEPALLGLSRDAALEAAVRDVAGLWPAGRLEQTWVRTHLQQLKRLDLPAVLELFHPARRDTCFVAVRRLGPESAEVLVGGQPMRVAVAELDRLWTRQALLLWRDHESLGASPEAALQAPFTRQTLGRLGYAPERDLPGAVARFQQELGLASDGVVGARTLLALYSLGRQDHPHLSEGAL